jgi:chromate transporter
MNTLLFGAMGPDAAQLGQLFVHFAMLSLLAVGGAISTAPDMQRYVVGEKGWLSDAQFTSSVAIAQAAPGPNVLFVAVLGWNMAGLVGVLATMTGTLLPSTLLLLGATRWREQRRESRAMRALSSGLAPLTLGLLLATGWILTEPVRDDPLALLLVPATVLLMMKTKLGPLWAIGAGALVGAFGLTT